MSTPQGAVGTGLYDAFSRGTLHFTAADPEAKPVIDGNMLDDPRDRLRMSDAVRRLAGLAAHPALADLATAIRFGESPLAIDDAAPLPDNELDALMLAEAGDIQHAAGRTRPEASFPISRFAKSTGCRFAMPPSCRGIAGPTGTSPA